MIKIYIKTWRCTTCGYAYSGAIPPTAEQHTFLATNPKATRDDRIFFGLKDMECPNCRTITMEKVDPTDPKWAHIPEPRTTHEHIEQSDIDALEAELLAAPPIKISVGEELRVETNKEKAERIETETLKTRLPTKEKALHTTLSLEQPNLTRKFIVYRDEFPHEQQARVSKHLEALTPVTPEILAQDREFFEDK